MSSRGEGRQRQVDPEVATHSPAQRDAGCMRRRCRRRARRRTVKISSGAGPRVSLPGIQAYASAKAAQRRLGTPDDIAYGVLFSASEYAGWITDQVLSID